MNGNTKRYAYKKVTPLPMGKKGSNFYNQDIRDPKHRKIVKKEKALGLLPRGTQKYPINHSRTSQFTNFANLKPPTHQYYSHKTTRPKVTCKPKIFSHTCKIVRTLRNLT